MAPTIIIDFHDSRRGRDALALARSLGDAVGARLVTVTSYLRDRHGMLPVQGWHWAMPDQTKAAADLARRLMADEPGGVARLVGGASPADALHEVAEREQADLIVVGSEARVDDGRVTAGGSGRQALQGARCAVAFAPAGFAETDGGLAPVGVGFDGSPESHLALATAASVAEHVGGELHAISVFSCPPLEHPMFDLTSQHRHLEQLQEERRAALTEAVDALPGDPEVKPLVIDGEPANVLGYHTAKLGLLVLGSRGHGPLRRVLLGSVSDALLDGAGCPVLIVPRGVQRVFEAPIQSENRATAASR